MNSEPIEIVEAIEKCRILGVLDDGINSLSQSALAHLQSAQLVIGGARTLAETSTLRTGSNPATLVLLGDRLRPVTRKDLRSIQALQQTAAAGSVSSTSSLTGAAAAAERGCSAAEDSLRPGR